MILSQQYVIFQPGKSTNFMDLISSLKCYICPKETMEMNSNIQVRAYVPEDVTDIILIVFSMMVE